jgi:hypothetical protein
MATYRTAQLDADNRREPKTECFCVRCHKDLKEGQPRRFVHIEDSSHARVVHPADTAAFEAADTLHGDMGWFPVGMACAKAIGLEFTSP